MLAALTLATIATVAVVWWYPYPDLQASYAAMGGFLMTAFSVGFVLMRREKKREVERRSTYQAVIWTSAFFLVFVAPTCIGTLTASAP
jgi:putative Ca2+/H+ antiporter (TMEM165/GDT1 family)